MDAALYLIPVTLGDTAHEKVLPQHNAEIIRQISHFVVENIRTARRFLRKAVPDIDIDSLSFYAIDKHNADAAPPPVVSLVGEGHAVGLLSEAGCPAIADPGAEIVAMAQENNIAVRPLVGPSSILLSLMASGFNGQNFAFNGYLPIDETERMNAIRGLENRIYGNAQTQIVIETPYRNNRLVLDLLRHCRPSTRLCIAVNITLDDESIRTLPISRWREAIPDINKKTAIFLLYK
jgi:16S rRNA (cytidine1402-2'-O)-methyltransferase